VQQPLHWIGRAGTQRTGKALLTVPDACLHAPRLLTPSTRVCLAPPLCSRFEASVISKCWEVGEQCQVRGLVGWMESAALQAAPCLRCVCRSVAGVLLQHSVVCNAVLVGTRLHGSGDAGGRYTLLTSMPGRSVSLQVYWNDDECAGAGKWWLGTIVQVGPECAPCKSARPCVQRFCSICNPWPTAALPVACCALPRKCPGGLVSAGLHA